MKRHNQTLIISCQLMDLGISLFYAALFPKEPFSSTKFSEFYPESPFFTTFSMIKIDINGQVESRKKLTILSRQT